MCCGGLGRRRLAGRRCDRHEVQRAAVRLAGADYDEHFAVPHRRAYDELAWEICAAALPGRRRPTSSTSAAGSAAGPTRLLAAGYRVTGIEPAPAMADTRPGGWLGRHRAG